MSLRRRLAMAVLFVVATFALVSIIIIRSQRSFLIDQVDQGLERIRPVASAEPQPPPRDPTGEALLSGPAVSNIYVGAIAESGQTTVYVSGELLDDVPLLQIDDALETNLDSETPFTVSGISGRSRFRVIGIERPNDQGWIVAALPLKAADEAVTRLKLSLLAAGVALLAALSLISWWVERLGLRPVAHLTETAQSITAGDRSQRVETGDLNTEAGQLAVAFNQMLDERDRSDGKLRQFVSDASHELRTPLTTIRGYLDLYASNGLDDPAVMDDAVRRMTQESVRMQDLTEDLLLIASLEQGRELVSEPVDLAVILRDAALDARASQPKRTVNLDSPESMMVNGDPSRLRQLVSNLVTNALIHTYPDATVELSLSKDGGMAELVVADSGPGLEAETAERIFDRFYRGDTSRDRSSGGAGLGLAIAQSIAEAHGGTIELETTPGDGCRFTVGLPVGETL